MGPLPYMAFLWLLNGGDPCVLTNWDDPPSSAWCFTGVSVGTSNIIYFLGPVAPLFHF